MKSLVKRVLGSKPVMGFSLLGLLIVGTLFYSRTVHNTSAATIPEPYSVVVVAGQSNAQGVGGLASQIVPALGSHPADAATLMMYSESDEQVNQAWTESSSSSLVPLTSLQLNSYFGPEISLARKLWDQGRRNMVVLKVTYGGQRLASVTAPATGAVSDWNVNSSNESYDKLISRYNDMRNIMLANGDMFTVDGLYWMQGESDAAKGESQVAYENNLNDLISSLKSDIGMHPGAQTALAKISTKYCTDNPWSLVFSAGCPIEFCFVPQQPCSNLPTALAGNTNVRAALQAVADADPSVSIVETEDLPRTSVDWVHITSPGQITLGNRFADATKQFLPQRVEGSSDYDGDGVLNIDEDTNGNGNLGDDDSDSDGIPNYQDSINGPGGGPVSNFGSVTKIASDNATGSTTSTSRDSLVDWVVSYANDTTGMLNVRIDDSIIGNHKYVSNSLVVPGGHDKQFSINNGGSFGSSDTGVATTNLRSEKQFISSPATGETEALPQPLANTITTVGGDPFAPIVYKGKLINLHHHSNAFLNQNAIDCLIASTGAACSVPGVTFPNYISSQIGPIGSGVRDLNTTTMYREFIDDGTYGNEDNMYFSATAPNFVTPALSTAGVACVNVVTFQNCGYTVLGTGAQFAQKGDSPSNSTIEGIERNGSRLYSVAGDGLVHCFDMATDASCVGQPYSTGWSPWVATQHTQGMAMPHIMSGSKMFVSVNYAYKCQTGYYFDFGTFSFQPNCTDFNKQTRTYCFDTAINAVCVGWPNPFYTTAGSNNAPDVDSGAIMGLFEQKNTSGTTTGICAVGQVQSGFSLSPINYCYDISTGAPSGFPANLKNFLPSVASPYTQALHLGTKLYIGYIEPGAFIANSGTGTFVVCYDFTIQDQCTNFGNIPAGPSPRVATFPSVKSTRSGIYAIREYDGCLWAAGDDNISGSVWSFDPDTGQFPCATASVQENESIVPADYYCDGATNNISGWGSVRLVRGDVSDYSKILVTVLDASGNPISGYTDIDVLTLGGNVTTPGSLDISALSYLTHQSLSYKVTAKVNPAADPWIVPSNSPYFQMTYVGNDPQICYQTRVDDECDITAPLQNDAEIRMTNSTNQVNTSNGSASLSVDYAVGERCVPDVSVAKDDSQTVVYPNQTLTYVITVQNNSSNDPQSTANGVVISDTLPANTTFISASDGGMESAGVVTWPAVTIAGGASVTRTVQLSLNQDIPLANNVVNLALADLANDPTPGDNSSTDTDTLGLSASLGDKVWLDSDRDGIQDVGENGLPNVTVELLKGGVVVGTDTTDSSGNYLFESLEPSNDYQVRIVVPLGYQVSPKDQGSIDSVDSDIDVTTFTSGITTLDSGEDDMSWDAGLNMIPATIGNVVWEDLNNNGVRDSGEPGIAGVEVTLLKDGVAIATQTTNTLGEFVFTDVEPGTGYALRFGRPSGYDPTTNNAGSNNGIDSDIDPNSYTTELIDLAAGQSDLSWFAGFVKTASVVNPTTGGGSNSTGLTGLVKTGVGVSAGFSSLVLLVLAKRAFSERKSAAFVKNKQYYRIK